MSIARVLSELWKERERIVREIQDLEHFSGASQDEIDPRRSA
jgi:hypothetical protein